MPAVEHERHRRRGGKPFQKRHETDDARAAEELDDHCQRADRQRDGGRRRHAGIGAEHAVEHDVQRQYAEVDEQRHERFLHRVVRLVQKVEHGERAHAEGVAGEDAARHLRGRGGEAAALEDHTDDVGAEGAHHRADGEDKEQRVLRHIPDIAEVTLRVLAGELAVEAREHDRADAVEHARRERGEELVGIVEGAHRAVVERGGGRGVDEVAEEKHRGREDGDERRFEIGADVVRPAVEHRSVDIMLLPRVWNAHAELEQPRAGARDDDAQNAPPCAECQQEDGEEGVVGDAHAALQLVVVGRLKDGDVQIRRRHDRQGAGHDADIAHQPRKLRCVGVPEHTDERRRGQDLPNRDHDQRAEQRHGHQVVRRALAAPAVGGKFLGEDRHRRDAQRVADGREKVERGVVGRGVEVRVHAGAEDVRLHHLTHHAEELGKERQQENDADRTRRAHAGLLVLSRRGRLCFLFVLHDRADHLLIRVELSGKLVHVPLHAGGLLRSVCKHARSLRLKRLGCVAVPRAELVEPHGVEERRTLGVVGDADERHAHDGGVDQRMEPHAHEQIHAADDREHILGKVFFVQTDRRIVGKLRGDVTADLTVLLIVERNEHRLRVVGLLQPSDRAQDLRDKAAVPVPLADGPADHGAAVLRHARAAEDGLPHRPVRLFHADDRVRRDDDPLRRNADLRKQRRRALVAHHDAVRAPERARRGAAVGVLLDRADALRIDENLLAQQLREADDGKVVVQALAARHVLQQAAAARDEHIAAPHRPRDGKGRHTLHRLHAVFFARSGGIV